jgi:FkbM family methyltransferase
MYNEALGAIETVGNKQFLITHKDRDGIALYGPYIYYDPGRYVVTFAISIEQYSPYYTDAIVAIVEVMAFAGNAVLARSNVYASRLLAGKNRISLGFSLLGKSELEFRVRTTGRASLRIDFDRTIYKLAEHEANYSPLLDPGEKPIDPFFLNHFDHLRGLYESGALVRVDETGTIASYPGVSFYVRNIEDFQVATEVFVYNEYNFRSNRDCIAVDIGMNVGLTSLYMANIPTVRDVYSFEPFKAPYQRALENLSLNPTLSSKIKPFNYGLGATDERLTILSHEDLTIGTSVKGLAGGTPEEIIIRDASEEIGKIVDDAKRKNLDVVVKVDCEGSEFPIFDTLEKAGLVKEVMVFLIEWHKWWAADRTQVEIVSCLTKNDFIVVDRTIASDICAGQLYAVRTSSGKTWRRSIASAEAWLNPFAR